MGKIQRFGISRRRFLFAANAAAASCAFLNSEWLRALETVSGASRLASDPLRPQFHLLPPGNWMNDPNGPIWWKGKYHLFYQLNPKGPVWDDMNWGHSESTDMVHWKHDPVALAPTPGGPDGVGCFSGSAVVFDGVPTVIYTGVQYAPPEQVTLRDGGDKLREVQMLATAEDGDLLRWKKADQPVIAVPPSTIKVTGFRDPCPWKEDDGWYLGVGSGERGKGGCVLLYRSQDLRHWEYLHPLVWGKPNGKKAANPCDSGEMWECPDFFQLGDRHCLLYSTEGHVFWTTGRYDREKHVYTPEQTGLLDHGAYYAPKSFRAPDGRRILWGWVQERRPEAEYAAAGWAGMISLPRVLTIGPDGRLRMQVAEEVQQLRGAERRPQVPKATGSNAAVSLAEFAGCCGELKVAARRSADAFDVQFTTADGTQRLQLSYVPSEPQRITVDGEPISLDSDARGEFQMHAFVDGSVIELFINDRHASTKRFYYAGPAQKMQVAWKGNARDLVSSANWELAPISKNRLTSTA